MRQSVTSRGFALIEFSDSYEQDCSLQKSSSAEEDCIWFGVTNPYVRVMARFHPELATKRTDVPPSERHNGWVDLPLPEDVCVGGRMHLTREQVKALLPALRHFVRTGELPEASE